MSGNPEVPEWYDYREGPYWELFRHHPEFHEGLADPVELAKFAGHNDTKVPFDLEYFESKNNCPHNANDPALWEAKGVYDLMRYMHSKGTLQTLGPSIEKQIEIATGALNEDVWSDVQCYLQILFTEEQQNQIRLDRLMRESQRLDSGGSEISEARNMLQYMDYNPRE